jgi:hypothetical protein
LTQEDANEARERIERNERGYREGVAVIDNEARWTKEGEAALSSAKVYMTSNIGMVGAAP